MACERRGEKSQPTQTGKGHQHAEKSRQKRRLENEAADQEVKESKKYEVHIGGLGIQVEKHQRQSLPLFRRKYAQVVASSQDDQWGALKEAAGSLNGASHETEEHRK